MLACSLVFWEQFLALTISIRDSFSSLDASNGPKIVLGDDSETKSKGKGRIDIHHDSFNNVLYVPGIVGNLLSVY